MVAIPLLLLAAGGGVTAALIIHHNNQVAAQQVAHRRAVARAARAAAARRQQQAAARQQLQQQQQQRQQLQNAERKVIVTSLEGAVQKSAQKDVAQGLLKGPILSANCQPATAADATALIANYSCIAVNSLNGTTQSGYRFSATVNVSSGSYTWHLG